LLNERFDIPGLDKFLGRIVAPGSETSLRFANLSRLSIEELCRSGFAEAMQPRQPEPYRFILYALPLAMIFHTKMSG